MVVKIISILVLLTVIQMSAGLDTGLGKTPAMGWNSWNYYGCNINEEIVRETAQLLISTCLAKKGYVYVNIDDCWQKERDVNGRIVDDKEAFPFGMKELADYIHSLGLKFGLYSNAGTMTCQKRPGGLNYEDIDAQTYTEWGC